MDQNLDVQAIDIQSRAHWSTLVAKVLLGAIPRDVLHTIIASGRDEFIRVATLQLAGQDLRREDFSRIYDMLSLAIGRIPQ